MTSINTITSLTIMAAAMSAAGAVGLFAVLMIYVTDRTNAFMGIRHRHAAYAIRKTSTKTITEPCEP